jgi:type IV pilus assembly protein PilC
MKRYKYKAKNEKGELITGEVEAGTPEHAAKLIRRQGLIVISITAKSGLSSDILKKYGERITMADITTFTRQFATMVNSGLPLTEALLILRSQAKGSMQKVVAQLLADVEEGESLSSSMSKHPQAFSKTYVALVKSGEMGGVMDEVLVRLADNMERQQEFRGKVKGALIYPTIIVLGMIGVAFVMMVFVLPQITDLFTQFDIDLPITTKILIFVSDLMARFWPLMILAFAGLAYGFKTYRSTENGKRKVDDLILKIPLIGDLQRQIVLADLSRTLSLMVGAGVSINESITISSEVAGNMVVADALKDVNKMVEKGFPIAFSFSRHPEAFPFILSQMVAVGEETGKIDEVLEKISHVFEVESDQKLKALTAAVEPIIMVVLGIGVAFLVISVIMPIYNLTTSI